MADTILRSAALRVAGNRLPLRSAKKTQANLEAMGADLAEAYRIGAEETQIDIVTRLAAIPVQGRRRAGSRYRSRAMRTKGVEIWVRRTDGKPFEVRPKYLGGSNYIAPDYRMVRPVGRKAWQKWAISYLKQECLPPVRPR